MPICYHQITFIRSSDGIEDLASSSGREGPLPQTLSDRDLQENPDWGYRQGHSDTQVSLVVLAIIGAMVDDHRRVEKLMYERVIACSPWPEVLLTYIRDEHCRTGFA